MGGGSGFKPSKESVAKAQTYMKICPKSMETPQNPTTLVLLYCTTYLTVTVLEPRSPEIKTSGVSQYLCWTW